MGKKYLDSFNRVIKKEDVGPDARIIPICTFATKWCLITPLLSQRVILKLYAGEKLLSEVLPGYEMSEQEWFDTMYDKGYFPSKIKEAVEEGRGFQDILLVVGRRGGKSTMIAVAALYSVYKVLMYDNPQKYYNMQEGSVIEISVAAKTGKQAERAPFAKIRAICEKAIINDSPLARVVEDIKSQTIIFLTEADRTKREKLKEQGIRRPNYGTIHIEAYNSNTDSFRGGAVIAAIMDEFAQYSIHQQTGEDAAEYFYDTLVPSVHQFKEDGRVFILSTPQGKVGKFWQLYNDVWEGESTNTIGVKMPVWEAWSGMPPSPAKITLQSLADDKRIPFNWDYRGLRTPDGKPEPFSKAWANTPASVRREYGAEFEGTENQWIPEVLIVNPEDPILGFRWMHYNKITQGVMGRVYVAHADPARTNDGFAIAVGHKEVNDERGEEIIIDHAYRWIVQPYDRYVSPGEEYETIIPKDGPTPAHVKFSDVREYIQKYILMRFHIQILTMDQWNSQLMIEDLAEFCMEKGLMTGIELLNFTAPLNKTKDDMFEKLILEHRIHSYYHPPLEKEITSLQKDKFGRISARPGEHDDLYDCISVVAMKAMELPEFTDMSRSGNPFNIMPLTAGVNL
jgi:hypothetical protein